jgi:transcriptional regulator with GAF, ATPase, and Fis domain
LPDLGKHRDRAQDLEALYELARDLLQIEDYDALLDAVVRRALALLGGERGFLVLTRGQRLDYKVIKNWSPAEYEGGKEPISRSVLSELLSREAPLLIEDAASDPRFQHQKSVEAHLIRSILAAPLYVEGELTGALYLESRADDRFFDAGELALFQKILELSSRALESCLRRLLLARDASSRAEELFARYDLAGVVTRDPALLAVLEAATRVAAAELPVLIQGPSGTGKELVARAIHKNSPRAKRPLVTINCGAISPQLMESELFGHVKGAFTGATQTKAGLISAAHQGTLFLDEISELPKELQVKLLRTLQFGEVLPVGSSQVQAFDVRFLAATNRDLEKEAREGRFREDLLYRLNAITLRLPSLKERPGDVLPLFYHFLRGAAERAGRAVPEVPPALERALAEYSWPGNVRELENEAKRLLALTPPGAALSRELLSPALLARSGPAPSSLASQEKELIEEHLRRAGGNRTRAAETLGVSREGLRRMMKRYGIT